MNILANEFLQTFKIRFWTKTVLPPVDEATIILLNGNFGTCSYSDCLSSYSVMFIGFIIGTSVIVDIKEI